MSFKIIKTKFDDVFIIEYKIFNDNRGSFFELFNESKFKENNLISNFIQDNISISKKAVLRGLHLQKNEFSQAKIIKVLNGKILDVIVDLRKESKTFGEYIKVELDSTSNRIIYIGRNFAHGFLALEDDTIVLYKVDNKYNPHQELTINWNDETLKIDWEEKKYNIDKIILSEKDKNGISFKKYQEEI